MNVMKKFIYFSLIAALCVLPFSSCSDMLDEESRTEIDKEKYMLNAAEAEVVLLGVYRNMVTDAMYGYHLSILFDMGTDVSQVEGSNNNGFRAVPTNSFTTSAAEIQNTWSMLYNSVYNANDFIETLESKIGSYTEADKQVATLYLAEAKGLRALYYFELVRRYGNIALMTNTAMSKQHPSTFVQADPARVYEFIEQDLRYAAETLPYAQDDVLRKSNAFRLSKGSALGLLAKVYATWAGYPVLDASKWELAAKTAEELMASNKHALLSDYEQLWKNSGAGVWNASESLMEVSFYAPTTTGAAEDPCGRIGKWNGVKTSAIAGERGSNAGNVKVVHSFVLEWRAEPQDLRCNLSVANYQYNPGKVLWASSKSDTPEVAEANDADPTKRQKEKQSYTPAKWDTEKYVPQSNKLINNDKSNVNWYLLRYADVLLIYAEAMNEWKGAPTPEAYEAINQVRRRGYGMPVATPSAVADLPAGLSVSAFRDAVRKERAYELAFEGHRRLDLIRWGIYRSTIDATAKKLAQWWTADGEVNYVVKKYTEDKHILFPIPQRDMDLTNFTQNKGWY